MKLNSLIGEAKLKQKQNLAAETQLQRKNEPRLH